MAAAAVTDPIDGTRSGVCEVAAMDDQLDRLQDRDGRFSAVVRLVHCITGPRLRRRYLVGTDQAVILGGGHYLDELVLKLRICSGYGVHS